MPWSVPTKGFLCLVTSDFVDPLPANCTYFLNTDTSPTTRAIGGENITFQITPARSGRNRTASDGKLAGMHFTESVGASSTTYSFSVPNGDYRIRLAQGDSAGAQAGGQILIKDGATTRATLAGGASLNLFRDASGANRASVAAWLADNASVDIEVVSGQINLVCASNYTTDDFWLSYIEITQLAEDPFIPNVYVNGVGHGVREPGDGSVLKPLFASLAAGGLGGTLEVDVSELTPGEITLSSSWVMPVNSGPEIVIGAYEPDLVHAPITTRFAPPIPYSKKAQTLILRYTAGNSTPMIQMAKTMRNIRWRVVTFDYGNGTGNVALITSPWDVIFFNTPEQDAYLPSEQPDGIVFDRCLTEPKAFGTQSFQAIKHLGKAITFRGCSPQLMRATGGQNDGYWCHGDVGDGPWLLENCDTGLVRGEVQGFGSHAMRSGALGDGVEPPGFEAFAAVDHIPLSQGYVMRAQRIIRDPATRWACWTTTDPITVATGSKNLTVPPNMPFVASEALRIDDGGSKVMTGTVTSYSGTTLVANVDTVVSGSGSITGGAFVKRTAQEWTYKTHLGEWTYGQDIILDGWVCQNHWYDFNTQNAALNIKLSVQILESLNHVPIRRVTVRNGIFLSLAAWFGISDYFGHATSPPQEGFYFDNCALIDVDAIKYGAPGLSPIMGLGTDMPASFHLTRTLIDVANQPTGLMNYGTAGVGHPSIAQFVDHRWQSNILLQQGTETYEIFGYYGTGPTNATTPKGYLEDACASVVFTHNSVVSGDPVNGWGSATKDPSNTWYTAAQRAALLAKLRNPTAAVLTDRDYRYLAGQEEFGADGKPRGPNWWEIYQATGWAWPFSWVPEAPPASLRQPNPVHVVRRLWPRQAPRPVRAR